MSEVKRALLSVTDKTGIVDLARGLIEKGYEIISTGGTATKLKEAGIDVLDCADYTGVKQTPLLKTMTDRIYGAIFYPGSNSEDVEKRKQLVSDMVDMYTQDLGITNEQREGIVEKISIVPVTFVANNFYDFQEGIEEGATVVEATNGIDVGGPTIDRTILKMSLREKSVAVSTRPDQYQAILNEMDDGGALPQDVRNFLAVQAFRDIHKYDSGIENYLTDHAMENPDWARIPEE